MNESSCTCKKCVGMCKTRPCLPTPAEAWALLDRFPDRMMSILTDSSPPVWLISPAIVGKESQIVSGYEGGRCTFLDENDRCELHDLGLKPLEGRLAIHDEPWQPRREHVLSIWVGRPAKIVRWTT